MGNRHRDNKLVLVKEFGGKCSKCGYDKEPRILNFHHTKPNKKSFTIARRTSGNLKMLRKEAAKCILLCANCHQEFHLGLFKI
jgi:hypothetical protein